ncbi:MAG TPA: type I-C CRISPR-associated protein Cas8c/Csd1 [Clostridiales bacterium]|nr:type I-C CRISPR-associated protein Cas8c/Csd1 [Clostridiales bacterium]
MALLQRAIETYDTLDTLGFVGVYEADKTPLAPIAHWLTAPNIDITIDLEGNFLSVNQVDTKTKGKFIFPVTESSLGRTSGISPHPLCDQLDYFLDSCPKKRQPYMDQLFAWEQSSYTHPIIQAVYKYLQKNTIEQDLLSLTKKYTGKDMVRWIVYGVDEPCCWKNHELFESYIHYIQSEKTEKSLCMLTGDLSRPAEQHSKGIVAMHGNAKLISANDTSNYTFRGRFKSGDEALSISYLASQKAHNAIKYLTDNHSINIGKRFFVCWNPQGDEVPQPSLPFLTPSEPILTMTDYSNALSKKLFGWTNTFDFSSIAVVAVFDAATNGRLSVTYYSELQATDFAERLCYWDETCAWWNGRYGIQSPALRKMAQIVFGTYRERDNMGWFECDDNVLKVLKQQLQRLLVCRIEKALFPYDIVQALVFRCERLYLYSRNIREDLLFVTCAAIRKYYYDHKKEVIQLSLDPEKKDRSYQYGRLLALMEKAERDTYDGDEGREPNAMRLLPIFTQRPLYATKSIIEQLKKAYFPQLRPPLRIWYDRQIGEIFTILDSLNTPGYDAPLNEQYLIGYYLQKQNMYTKKNKEVEEE